MCLILQSKDAQMRNTSEPISVWKVLAHEHSDVYHWDGMHDFVSPYHPRKGPRWEPGKGYDTQLGQPWQSPIPQSSHRAAMFAAGPMSAINASMTVEIGYRIDEGFHSFGSEDAARELAHHLYWEQDRSRRMPSRLEVVEMTIPCGSTYYHDTKHDEYVSDRIYFNDEQGS